MTVPDAPAPPPAYPRITANARYGRVFLRFIRRTRIGLVSDVARLTPEVADAIADELRDCARRARKEPKPARLKIARTHKEADHAP
jgi:hypothetical protein